MITIDGFSLNVRNLKKMIRFYSNVFGISYPKVITIPGGGGMAEGTSDNGRFRMSIYQFDPKFLPNPKKIANCTMRFVTLPDEIPQLINNVKKYDGRYVRTVNIDESNDMVVIEDPEGNLIDIIASSYTN